MKKSVLILVTCFVVLSMPSLSFAKGVPLFFQTGDELFEIKGAPKVQDDYSVGYACKRFGIFGADIWTWDCNVMAVNLADFSAGDLEPQFKSEMESKYNESDRKRGLWNHYGAAAFILIFSVLGLRKRN